MSDYTKVPRYDREKVKPNSCANCHRRPICGIGQDYSEYWQKELGLRCDRWEADD